MKSTTAFFKDLDTKFGTVNYSTDICVIAIEHNAFHLMAAPWSFRNLHSRKSTTRKSMFGSIPSELIWRMMLSKSRQNSWKMPVKEPTLLQSCWLEACSCTKNEHCHSHPPRILWRSWLIIYDYFKNLRTTFIPEYFSTATSLHCFFLIVMLSLQILTKYNLNGTAYCDSNLQLRLSNFVHK